MEPSEPEPEIALYRQLAPEGIGTTNFVRAKVALKQVQDRTGRDPEELIVWLEELEANARELEQRYRDIAHCPRRRLAS